MYSDRGFVIASYGFGLRFFTRGSTRSGRLPISSDAIADNSPATRQQEKPAPKEEGQPATSASLPVTIPTQRIVDEPKDLLPLGAKTVEPAAIVEPNQTTVPI